MKMGMLFACLVPELRKMSGAQLMDVWHSCTAHSRLKIYLHIVLLMACCSAIFNFAMWLRVEARSLSIAAGANIGLSNLR